MFASGFTDTDVPDQSGRTIVVTGANTGLGFETSLVLAGKGARVLLACRSEDKALKAMGLIEAKVPNADLGFVALDQGDLSSVREAAAVMAEEPRIDVLVNNAGIMMPPREMTVDGFESQFGVNHLGTFALTGLLLPKLSENKGARVVVTSSLAHRSGRIMFDDLEATGSYRAQERYGQSKLANLLFTYELDRRLRAAESSTIAVVCHPGIADTELSRSLPAAVRILTPLIRPMFNTPLEGAWPTLMAATSPNVKGGQYFGPARRFETAGPARKVDSSARSKDEDLAARLWDISVELTGVDAATFGC